MGAKPPIRFQHYMRRFSRTPAVGQASREYTQKRSQTAFKYLASRSQLPYGCIKIARDSSAIELALPQSWSRGRAADRNIDAE